MATVLSKYFCDQICLLSRGHSRLPAHFHKRRLGFYSLYSFGVPALMTLTVGLLNQADLSSRFFQYPNFLLTFWAGLTGMDYLFILMFRSSHFSFLVFGYFWRRSYENTKILCNLCLHFARQDGQNGKKWKKITQLKWPKYQTTKDKIWDERNIYK